MTYQVRPMREEDIPQVAEIEKEAFPTQWPPTAFKRELQNRIAHYLVACEDKGVVGGVENPHPQDRPMAVKRQGWLSWLKGFWGREKKAEVRPMPNHYIVGAVGFWMMLDEAHITTIAVRSALQRHGIGELLLIRSIELAQELGAQVVTLEVRATNSGAQALYEKYGFQRTGRRRGYYTDNHEDAIIMSTDRITPATYQSRFQGLKEEHARKWDHDLPAS